jgi:hypothetical protein
MPQKGSPWDPRFLRDLGLEENAVLAHLRDVVTSPSMFGTPFAGIPSHLLADIACLTLATVQAVVGYESRWCYHVVRFDICVVLTELPTYARAYRDLVVLAVPNPATTNRVAYQFRLIETVADMANEVITAGKPVDLRPPLVTDLVKWGADSGTITVGDAAGSLTQLTGEIRDWRPQVRAGLWTKKDNKVITRTMIEEVDV